MKRKSYQRRTAHTIARGYKIKGGIKTGVTFYEPTFKTIRKMAAENGISFSEQVRIIVDCGIDAILNVDQDRDE